MRPDSPRSDLALVPKVELHLHLDCSLSYEFVSQMRPGIMPDEFKRDFSCTVTCSGLAELLERSRNGVALMQTEESLRLAVRDLFRQLQEDRVIYAELRFAPFLHTQEGLLPERVVELVEREASDSCRATGIEARLILCTLRHFGESESLRTARLVEAFSGSRVAALDIAGDEAGFPIDAHLRAFQYAIERNIPRTAHAGEARGPRSVWETLEHFKPSRIGHGVRSLEDPALMQHLQREQIHLEVCPTSNVRIGLYESYEKHPVDRLRRSGLSVGINTDGRTLVNVSLGEEYRSLQEVFEWSPGDFLQCNANALRAAFIPEDVRTGLMGRIVAAGL